MKTLLLSLLISTPTPDYEAMDAAVANKQLAQVVVPKSSATNTGSQCVWCS